MASVPAPGTYPAVRNLGVLLFLAGAIHLAGILGTEFWLEQTVFQLSSQTSANAALSANAWATQAGSGSWTAAMEIEAAMARATQFRMFLTVLTWTTASCAAALAMMNELSASSQPRHAHVTTASRVD